MPDIGVFHPQIVHFVIALLGVGVVLRMLSCFPLPAPLAFIRPTATLLLVIGTVAAFLAVRSGDDAHSIPERIPGARDAIENHEHWGQRTLYLFLIISAIDLFSLAIGRREQTKKASRFAGYVACALGAVGLFFLYETGEHGGEIVYEYAGGVGTRSGDAADVENLLVAGLYHAAVQDREAGRKEDAARLIDEMARRRPDDLEVRLLLVESHIKDRGDAPTALNLLNAISTLPNARLEARAGLLRVEAFETMGQADSAQATLQALKAKFPENTRVQERQLQVKTAPQPQPMPLPQAAPPPTTTTGN